MKKRTKSETYLYRAREVARTFANLLRVATDLPQRAASPYVYRDTQVDLADAATVRTLAGRSG